MQIHIQQHGVPLEPDLVRHIEQRLHFSLARFNGDIRRVTLQLTERRKTRCDMEVQTALGAPIFVQEMDSDVYAAVTRVCERAGRAVDRQTVAYATGLTAEQLPASARRYRQRLSSAALRRNSP